MNSIRILIADDHALVRAGLRSLLESITGAQVVAEAADGREALEGIKMHDPDIALLDIAMPGLNGLEATSRIAKEFPRVRVIILSMHASEEYVLQALRAGAVGYLLKDSSLSELDLALKAVVRGETYLTPAVSRTVIDDYRRRAAGGESSIGLLTPRQREVLQLIAEGKTTKEIAQILNISVKTVDTHRTQLMKRLGIHDIAGLVRYAFRVGLILPE